MGQTIGFELLAKGKMGPHMEQTIGFGAQAFKGGFLTKSKSVFLLLHKTKGIDSVSTNGFLVVVSWAQFFFCQHVSWLLVQPVGDSESHPVVSPLYLSREITERPRVPSGVAAFISAHSKTPYTTPSMDFPPAKG